MKRCKGCGAEFRKGAVAFLLTGGKLRGARVCQGCARDGVFICAPKLAPVVRKPVDRGDGVERALRALRVYAEAASASQKVTGGVGIWAALQQGRAEAYESAIEVIKRECGVGQFYWA
jgi:hypothetical protein